MVVGERIGSFSLLNFPLFKSLCMPTLHAVYVHDVHVHVYEPPSQFSRLGMWNICLSVYIFFLICGFQSLSLFFN